MFASVTEAREEEILAQGLRKRGLPYSGGQPAQAVPTKQPCHLPGSGWDSEEGCPLSVCRNHQGVRHGACFCPRP